MDTKTMVRFVRALDAHKRMMPYDGLSLATAKALLEAALVLPDDMGRDVKRALANASVLEALLTEVHDERLLEDLRSAHRRAVRLAADAIVMAMAEDQAEELAAE